MGWCRKCARMRSRCSKTNETCIRHALRRHPSDGGKVRAMTVAEGYVMARRPRCLPFVVSLNEWQSWTLVDDFTKDA